MKKTAQVHILTTVNASAVSKSGGIYTIRGVCGATDDIVMNGTLYPADQLAAGVATLNDRPAPAGHPKNAAGQFISATSGEAMLTSYIGAVCRNARHEGGRTLVDVVVNEAQAKANADGAKLVARLDAALSGTNVQPIHVSTGLVLEPISANGESRGKRYKRIATNLRYDHLAILLHENGAGTPSDGVGMFLNADGQTQEIEEVVCGNGPEDRRFDGITGWLRKLVGNDSDLSFDQIADGLRAALPDGAWPREVFARYLVFVTGDDRLFRQDYSVGSDGSVALQGLPVEVTRKVEYDPVSNSAINDEGYSMKDKILAALNAAGINAAGMDEAQLLAAYNALVTKPAQSALVAANSKIAEFEAAANAATDAEKKTIAAELAVNSALSVDDFMAFSLDRLKELKAKRTPAAPVTTGNADAKKPGDEFAGYDLNAIIDEKA